MKAVWRSLERLGHGMLLGGFIGALAGQVEFSVLAVNNTYLERFAQTYWDIMLSYSIVGAVAGIIVAVGAHLVLRPAKAFEQHMARLGAILVASGVFAYLAAWATYRLALPILKLSNIIAYLAAGVVAIVLGVLLERAARAPLQWLAGTSSRGTHLRRSIPLSLVLGILLVLFIPLQHTGKKATVPEVTVASAREGALGNRPNVVFILIDTLRADHLPMYGYARQTAPHLTALAHQGMTLRRMYAPASATRPSVASIFSAFYPAVHKTNFERSYLPDAFVTLAEVLRSAGYKTFAVSGNPNVSPVFGFAQGFDEYRLSLPDSALMLTMLGAVAEDIFRKKFNNLLEGRREIQRTAESLTNVTLQWVAQNGQGPCFLYVHYIDPHWPYKPLAPYDRAFDHRRDSLLREGGVDPLRLVQESAQAQVGNILDRYDGEIRYADEHIGRLLKGLEGQGLLENALIIVTSDHGEEFLEHGQSGHDKTVYEEVLHVPFLLSWPGHVPAGETYADLVSLVDVMPTILDFLGLETPPGLQGFSFAAQVQKQTDQKPARKFFAQQINDQRAIEMVRDGRYKFIRHIRGDYPGHEELYDMQEDPLERTNVARQEVLQVTGWRQELDAFNNLARQANRLIPDGQVEKLDNDTKRALRSLGYIK